MANRPLPLAPEDQRLLDFRNATNFRSVTRNDTSITEIIETSVYSVVYHYDESAGAWEKQKQEGPLFVVRRDKSPEYALYMLNRQTVKNVTLPLVPGEMKVTVVDAATLQVARRGEKLRRGIWFSEETAAVDRFRTTILRICGEPSKRTLAPQAGPSSLPASPASSPQYSASTEDGLSRLFAGLIKTPATAQPPTASAMPMPTQVKLPPAAVVTEPPAQPTSFSTSSHHSDQQPSPLPVSTIPSPLSEPIPPAEMLPPDSPFPAGQTVDDLLMSILGVAPMAPAPSILAPALDPRERVAPPPVQREPPLPPPETAPPVPPHPVIDSTSSETIARRLKPSKVGEATFAQAAAASSFNPLKHSTSSFSTNGPNSSSESSSPNVSTSIAAPVIPRAHAERLLSGPIPYLANGDIMSARTAMSIAVVDGVASRTGGRSTARVDRANEKVRKKEFVQRLLELVHTDQSFVDEVWEGYLVRTGEEAPG